MTTTPAIHPVLLADLARQGLDPSTVTLTTFDQLPWAPTDSDIDCAEDAPVVILPGWQVRDNQSGGTFHVAEEELSEVWEIAADDYQPGESTYGVDFDARRFGVVLSSEGLAVDIYGEWEASGSVTIEPEAPECEEGEHSWREVRESFGAGAGLRTVYECRLCGARKIHESDADGDGTMTSRTRYEAP